MTLLSFIIFLPAMFLGTLVIHLLWPERTPLALLLKFSLGIGLGLGFSSILYFLVLQVAPGRINMLTLQIILLVLLLVVMFLRARGQPKWDMIYVPGISPLQWGLVGATLLAFLISALIFINTITSRPQGEYDAWSIWNRAARFIYRDPENWRATLSPDISFAGHADYPLLVPLNVAWGWEALKNENLRVPMVQSALFTFSIIVVMFSTLAITRTIGQASLSALVLMASLGFVSTGTNLTADIPVGYFIFASGILMYLFSVRGDAAFLILSGFMAGLAGWTKNEGLLFIAISPIALIAASSKNFSRLLLFYLAGLAIPLLIIFYFKSMTPANDLMTNSGSSLIAKITDLSRYWTTLKSLALSFFTSNIIILLIYTVIMFNPKPNSSRGIYAIAAILLLQLLGYCVIFVITPNDLVWQLNTSQGRLILQVLPLILFLCFSISSDPESVFSQPFKKKI
jgi:hypothetical protein